MSLLDSAFSTRRKNCDAISVSAAPVAIPAIILDNCQPPSPPASQGLERLERDTLNLFPNKRPLGHSYLRPFQSLPLQAPLADVANRYGLFCQHA